MHKHPFDFGCPRLNAILNPILEAQTRVLASTACAMAHEIDTVRDAGAEEMMASGMLLVAGSFAAQCSGDVKVMRSYRDQLAAAVPQLDAAIARMEREGPDPEDVMGQILDMIQQQGKGPSNAN